MSNAQQSQPLPEGDIRLPGQALTLEETLRVMDVAREMRDQRETAEGMFQRDGVRQQLREKLMRQARVLNEDVTEAEIDAAIEQYISTLHRYEDPKRGFKSFVAHCWVWRNRILAGAGTAAVLLGSMWYMFA